MNTAAMLGVPTSSDVLAAKRRLENARRMADAAWNDPFTAVTGARALVDAAGAAQEAEDALMDLLHDIGKPSTLAGGHFVGHDVEGALLARSFLERLHSPRTLQEGVAHLVEQR